MSLDPASSIHNQSSAAGGAVSAGSRPALRVDNLSVTFGSTRALVGADLTLQTGTIHALLGGNGSGKSTLIKAVAGVVRPDDGGSITIGGRTYAATEMSPTRGLSAGLRFVHQDLGMFNEMTVAENFALYARYPLGTGGRVDWRSLNKRVANLLERFNIDASPQTELSRLRPSMKTMLAIARARQEDDDRDDLVLVLDEPTASLPSHEVDQLLKSLKSRALQGQSVLFVSHRLQEVLNLVDEITVLRDGQTVATVCASGTSQHDIIQHMAGRTVDALFARSRRRPTSERSNVIVKNLSAGPVRNVSFSVGAGEVLGIAGVLGSGRSAVLRAMFGDLPVSSGEITVGGRPGPFKSPTDAIDAGIGYVPEDRANDAAFLDLSVDSNLSATVAKEYFRRMWLRRSAERRDSEQLAKTFLIRTQSIANPLDSLSGGNQQKVVIARWLRRNPTLLLLDEPTQGVDVIARAEIYGLLNSAVERGLSVIVVSSDFDELVHLCDRVLAIVNGIGVQELSGDELTAGALLRLAHMYSPGVERRYSQ